MTWFATHAGHTFDAAAPDPATIDIVDLAHALAHLPRFLGHTRDFYSVAEHSIACVYANTAQLAETYDLPESVDADLHLLLHDGGEAYTGDLPGPFKTFTLLPDYTLWCRRVQLAVYQRFGVAVTEDPDFIYEEPPWLTTIDQRMLVTEARDLFARPPRWLLEPPYREVPPYRQPIVPKQNPRAVEQQFLAMYDLLRATHLPPHPRRRQPQQLRRRGQ